MRESTVLVDPVPDETVEDLTAGIEAVGVCKTTDMGKEITELKVAIAQVVDDKRQKWLERAAKIVRTYINIEVVPEKMAALRELVKKRPLAKVAGDNSGTMLLHYDVKSQGEPMSMPMIRICPFQEKKYAKLVTAVLGARSDLAPEDEDDAKVLLGQSEIAMIVDGGKFGNAKGLTAPWLPAAAKDDPENEEITVTTECRVEVYHRQLTLVKNQQSILERRPGAKSRGLATVGQAECAHIIGNISDQQPMQMRIGMRGENRQNSKLISLRDSRRGNWRPTTMKFIS